MNLVRYDEQSFSSRASFSLALRAFGGTPRNLLENSAHYGCSCNEVDTLRTIRSYTFYPLGVLLMAALANPSVGAAANLLKAVTFYASFDTAVRGDFGGGELTLSTRSNHKTEKVRSSSKRDFPRRRSASHRARASPAARWRRLMFCPTTAGSFSRQKETSPTRRGAGAERYRCG